MDECDRYELRRWAIHLHTTGPSPDAWKGVQARSALIKDTQIRRVTSPAVSVSLTAQLPHQGSSSCSRCTLVVSGALPPDTFWGLCPLTSQGSRNKLLSFDNAVPSSTLVNVFNSTHTVLKKGGTVEIQLLANAGVPARPQGPYHTAGQQEGTLLLGTQS